MSTPTFYTICDQHSRNRIVVDQGEDEPPYLPSAWKADKVLMPFVKAAVGASANEAQSDAEGLWWAMPEDAEKALAAVERAAGGGRR